MPDTRRHLLISHGDSGTLIKNIYPLGLGAGGGI